MATIKFNNYLKVQLQDPEFKAGYEIESAKLSSAVVTMKAWEAAGLTQRELAEKANVPQSTMARIERGDNTSIDTMSKIAFALGARLSIGFTPNNV
ncbi:helix-turn-helix domain-containing protein [Levilactobacillus cerevisiae]|uniref:helix-turn-helix domain-containing protein n=1 Tax=Levilactobacillus cerevisiae TaxID=1704076 RepID=UPI000F78538D|nr:helix-turn-helix transcriptional regulator [Levilactobacillus cerevisiae]